MKKYVKPTMNGEMFVANEYVGACWKVNCNVESGIGFIDTNGNGNYDPGIDKDICRENPRHGCGEFHAGVPGIAGDGPVANAMWVTKTTEWVNTGTFFNPNYEWVTTYGTPYEVYWWSTGNTDHDQHFTKISAAEWETNPNAS